MKKVIHIATRQSALALWQANHIQQKLISAHPELTVELVPITTTGDIQNKAPLYNVGGKALFVKELEEAIFEGRADIAVHSLKDVPMELPAGLVLGAVGEREDPRDAFVAARYKNLAELPKGSVLGTSSLRRACQLHALRPDLDIQPLRGNVDTRLKKMLSGEYDAIILAAAGLLRLGLQEHIREYLAPEICLPAVGQGVLAIELRANDAETQKIIQVLNHPTTWQCITAERAMNHRLHGSCQVPVAGFATLNHDQLTLRGMVGKPDGSLIVRAEATADANQAEALGQQVAEKLLAQGAAVILKSDY